MTIQRFSAFFSIFLFFSPVTGLANKVDVESCLKTIKNNIYKETLDNGLTLLFYHKENTPEVMLKVVYDVGSKDEESYEYGFAHLVEHMIFKGTQKLSEQDIFEISRKFGASNNAYTQYDSTTFYFETDNKNWRVFLAILADCMENVRIADEHLASEIKTVFEEIKMRNDDGAGDHFTELLPSNHPYHHPIIGYKENLLNLNPEKVRNFYKKYYRPDRAIIIVVGDLDKNDVVSEVKEKFGSIVCPEKSLKNKREKTEFDFINKDFVQKNITVYKSDPNTSVECLWTLPGSQDVKNALCAGIASKYLSDQLNKILRDEKALVPSVESYTQARLKADVFCISFQPQEQTSFFSKKSKDDVTELCKSIITEKINQLIVTGIPQDELTRIERIVKVWILKSFEHVSDIAQGFEAAYIINKNEHEFFDELALLATITNAEIKDFAHQYLRPNLMNIITTKPLQDKEKDLWLLQQNKIDEYDNSLLALQTRSLDLEKPVAAGQLPNPEALDVVFEKPDAEFTLSNGLQVVVKQRKDIPFITAMLSLKNEKKMERYFTEQNKRFIPRFSIDLLQEGSIGYSKEDHRKFFEDLGADFCSQYFSCLATDFDVMAQRHVHILTKPTYPKKSLTQILKNNLCSLEKIPENADLLAGYTLAKHLKQSDFLSKKTLKESMADLTKYKRSDLFEFHKKYITPCNMVLAVVGDFNEKTLKQQLENSYGQWKNSSQWCDIKKIDINFPVLKNPQAKMQKVYLPKERIILAAGRITVKDGDEDFFRIAFLREYINKKLFEIREQYGLFYDCSCPDLSLGATEYQQGLAMIVAELSLANVDTVSKLIKSILSDIAQNGIPSEDLETARKAFRNNRAKSNNTNDAITGVFLYLKAHDLDWDHSKNRFERFMNVSLNDVNAAARKYLNPDDWSFVIVGRVEEKGK